MEATQDQDGESIISYGKRIPISGPATYNHANELLETSFKSANFSDSLSEGFDRTRGVEGGSSVRVNVGETDESFPVQDMLNLLLPAKRENLDGSEGYHTPARSQRTGRM